MYALKRFLVTLSRMRPGRALLLGYGIYVVAGWILLCLPFSHEGDAGPGAIDALFIATSAVSTTGLATVDVPGTFSFFGELVLLLLIQAGGIGYMTFGSFVVIAGGHRLSSQRKDILTTSFSLPEGFSPRRFLRNVVTYTFAIEVAGAVALFFAFRNAGSPDALANAGSDSFSGTAQLAWHAVFHSVSAFCTAGFSLFPDSLESFRSSVGVTAAISALSLAGAVGFIVIADATRVAVGRAKRMTFTSRIIMKMTAMFLVLGTGLLFLADASLADLPAEERLLAAWFQCMTSTTTVGFNSVPISSLAAPSVFLVYVLMIIGASPSGTGGGLKSTSVSAILATVGSTLRGQKRITFRNVEVPAHRLQSAFAALGFYVLTLGAGGYLLLLTETRPSASSAPSFEDVVFEASSALGTVGLSRGLTADLTELGKVVIITLMLMGRLGPLTVGLALFGRDDAAETVTESEDMAV